jgi:hypothetical protein
MRQFFVLIPLLLAGCAKYPASLAPLCTDAEAFRDDRIVGTWRLKAIEPAKERNRIISFGELPDTASVTISPDSRSRYEFVIRHEDITIPFTCKLTKISDQLFLDLQRTPLDDPALRGTAIRPHFLVRCAISHDRIRLTGCRPDAFRRVLEQESLPWAESDSKTVYAGTTAQLRDVLSRHFVELFPAGAGDVLLLPCET